MTDLSYIGLLELENKDYRRLLNFLRDKHSSVLREWEEAKRHPRQECGHSVTVIDPYDNSCLVCRYEKQITQTP